MKKRLWAKQKNQEFSKSSKSDQAYRALIRLLYRRDHSEKELLQKLSLRYTPEAIQTALAKAKEHHYLKPPQELAQQLSEQLHRQGRGLRQINLALQKRGLPLAKIDPDLELAKCRESLQKKFGSYENLKTPERVKVYRYLTYRGFDSETIKKALRHET